MHGHTGCGMGSACWLHGVGSSPGVWRRARGGGVAWCGEWPCWEEQPLGAGSGPGVWRRTCGGVWGMAVCVWGGGAWPQGVVRGVLAGCREWPQGVV